MEQKDIIGYEEARAVLTAVHDRVLQELSEGKEETACSVAVVDDRGDLLAVMRMDGVASQTVYYAIKKARSAAMTRRDTRKQKELFERTGWQHADFGDFITTVPGGIIITKPGVSRERKAGKKGPEVYGGIGCSGRSADGDELLAFVGLYAIQKACWGQSDG